jgi:hypothetical protein
MLATLGGVLALALGLAILLLPLLATELSRPRDSAWGAVVLLLGLVLVTSADRLSGSPMLGVLCGGLLIGRLGTEVTQARWRQLTPEEQRRLWSVERWSSSLGQVAASLGRAGQLGAGLLGGLTAWISERRQKPAHGKRWVRPELAPAPGTAPASASASASGTFAAPAPAETAPDSRLETPSETETAPALPVHGAAEAVVVVSDFHGIEELLDASVPPEQPVDPAGPGEAG